MKGFLYGVRQMVYIAIGNYLPGDFSTPLRCARNDRAAWDRWHSLLQETVCEGFPILRWDNDIHGGRKLFAKGFLFGVRKMVCIVAGNCLRKVSYTAWGEWYT